MSTPPKSKLSGALGGNSDNINLMWDSTQAAEEFHPLPKGEYVCHVVGGEMVESKKKGTPAYQLTFKVIEGEFVGRRVRQSYWLTPDAIPYTKRELAKLGITSPKQFDQPVPPGIRCCVKVVLRTNDDGEEHNEVRSFAFIQVDNVEPDPFDTDGDSDDDDASIAGIPV